MLRKNNIDKKLKTYVKEHLGRGYSKKAVKHVLVNYGYEESYVDGLLKKHSELKFVKIYSAFALVLLVIFSFSLVQTSTQQKMTGYAVSSSNEGCCTSICQQTSSSECYGKFVVNKKCTELEDCKVGCCIDREGYCLTNYLYGNCISGYGHNINKDCNDLIFCRNITDKSYASRLYNIKGKKGAGTSVLKSSADYYKSAFNIKYFIYDKTNIQTVIANIVDNGNLVDSIALYDDGFHNDGAKNDNLYGNNWLSSILKDFEGFKNLDIDIIVTYVDSTQQTISKAQSIVVLGNSKCLPIYIGWESQKNRSIIFAADNYENLDDGYKKFEGDVQNFLDSLFSIGKFANSKDSFNIYRLEQSLSYFNIPTLASVVSSFCPSYSNKKDLLVVLDNNEDYCVAESKRVIRVNPSVLFYSNMTQDINKTFDDFCSYILTPKKLADEIISFATPPTIVVYTLDNVAYSTITVNLSFSTSALNYPINSSVFLDNELVSSKILSEAATELITLDLANGTNAVLISAIDKKGNMAFAQLLLNVTA